MNTLQDDSGANLQEVAPILDEAITQLGNEDRAAILLRFFEQRDFRSVAEALGSTEDAARMRVNRALEKLHALLTHRGVALSITALGTGLTAEAVKAAPAGNALAWYFSALDYFNSKQPDLAVRELAQAMSQHSFDTYAAQATQAVEEMCAFAGWPPLTARAWAPSSESASYLASLKNLANHLMQARQEELGRGDAAGANSLMSMGTVLANTLRSGSPMDQLVGIGIGRKMLGQLDPALNYGFLERAVSEELAALDRQKQTISEALAGRDQVLPALDEAELASYFERKKLYGEVSAVQWLQSKHRQP